MQSSQTEIKKAKAEARAHFLALRKQISSEYARAASDKICDGLLSLIKHKDIKLVLVYSPVRGEMDVRPLVQCLWESGITVAYPRSIASDTRLEFCTVTDETDLEAGEYGIPEPKAHCALLTDFRDALCVTPALSIDRDGFRLGYGKGYYDRFLSSHKITAVCPMYSCMLSDSIPHERTDVPIDIIQTEKEVIFSRG